MGTGTQVSGLSAPLLAPLIPLPENPSIQASVWVGDGWEQKQMVTQVEAMGWCHKPMSPLPLPHLLPASLGTTPGMGMCPALRWDGRGGNGNGCA